MSWLSLFLRSARFTEEEVPAPAPAAFPAVGALRELDLGSEDLPGPGLAMLTGCSHGNTQHGQHSQHTHNMYTTLNIG